MAKKKKILLSWSGGKDSAISLFELKSPDFTVEAFITSFAADKVQGHEISRELVQYQAKLAETPLLEVNMSAAPDNETYKKAFEEVLAPEIEKGLHGVAFGDISLEDVRKFKEDFLKELGLKAIFPLWGWSSELVLQAFSGLGHRAIVHAIQNSKLPPAFLGRAYNSSFTEDLPKGVNPCGENGEFHTFVFDGPFFQGTLPLKTAGTYEKDGYQFLEMGLNPEASSGHNQVN